MIDYTKILTVSGLLLVAACAAPRTQPKPPPTAAAAQSDNSGTVASGSVAATVGESVGGVPFAPVAALYTAWTSPSGRPELLLVLSDQSDLCERAEAREMASGGRTLQLRLFKQQAPTSFSQPGADVYAVEAADTPPGAGAYAAGTFLRTDATCAATRSTAQAGRVSVNSLQAGRSLTGALEVRFEDPNSIILSAGNFTASECPALVDLMDLPCTPGPQDLVWGAPDYTQSTLGAQAEQLVALGMGRTSPAPDTVVVPPSIFQAGALFALEMSVSNPNNAAAYYDALPDPYRTAVMAFVATHPGSPTDPALQMAAFVANPDQPAYDATALAQAAQRLMLANNEALGAPAPVTQADFTQAALWALDRMNVGPQSDYQRYVAGLQPPLKAPLRDFVLANVGNPTSSAEVQAAAAAAFPQNP